MPNTEVTGSEEVPNSKVADDPKVNTDPPTEGSEGEGDNNVVSINDGLSSDESVAGVIPPSGKGKGRHITDLLVELGFASQEQIDEAIEEARRSPALSPKQILLDRGVISPDQLSRALAERFGLDYLDLSVFNTNFAAANLITAESARRYRAVPVDYVSEGTVLLAMTDPANVLAVDDLSILTGHAIKPAVASPTDVEALITQLSNLDESIEAVILNDSDEEAEEVTDIKEVEDDAPVIRLTHAIISQALDVKASDIHFEPEDKEMRVRFRIDGVLQDVTTLPRRMIAGVTSRVKVMAELDIAEHRIPQDGRVGLKIDGRAVDIRVVTIPSSYGESVVMRLLDKQHSALELDKLGLQGTALDRFNNAIGKPYGATLVTGPTGSGKTTTLYAGLQILNTVEKSILTVEDPVEYQIEGITQMQVHIKAGLTFSNGLRSMLRADPDIIMVGEIRDRETARIAVEAALTGHLVLSTLHTNNAPAAITRLIDMGIEPFLIASALDCVVAQRLARTLCQNCKRPVHLEAEALRGSGFQVHDDVDAFEAEGCSRCSNTGFKGRMGVFEVMVISDAIRALTLERSSADEIGYKAEREGMMTLREDALEKVKQGISSVDEIARIIT